VTIARVDGVLRLPARFMLLAAYNPCPCGWFGVERQSCTCEDGVRRRYQARLSGPMRDRLDLHVQLEPNGFASPPVAPPEPSAAVADRVRRAWCVQRERQGVPNAELAPAMLDGAHGVPDAVHRVLETRARQMGLSLRRVHRAARLARTIADLDASPMVEPRHVDEALWYRPPPVAP
jgi:magnesium chelatase family protein